MDEDKINKIAMQMVMFAGDARDLIRKSLDLAEDNRFEEAAEMLEKAKTELANGHHVQTEILQKECEGEKQGYSVLFAHGMDSLMTVKSEYQITEKLTEILKKINDRMSKLEEI